jgi:hypothetical protein
MLACPGGWRGSVPSGAKYRSAVIDGAKFVSKQGKPGMPS